MESIHGSDPPLSLLVVEDDKAASRIICLMIPRKFPDVTIYVADNGRTGLETFKEQIPEVVITDINMPMMDGVVMVEEIKSIKADTKFIVLTGYSETSYLDKFKDIGINDYILKPIEFNKLFAAIEKCIDEIQLGRH